MKTIRPPKTVNNKNFRAKDLKMKMFAAFSFALLIGISAFPVDSARAKDSGFKLMMTPKWTGFPYFELAAKGGKAAADELGDTFTYAGADHADPTLQVETLQNFLTQKPDGILLAAIDLNAVAPVLKDARKRGIVVTTFDADAAVPARDMFCNQLSYEQAAKTMLDCALIDSPEGGEVAFVAASPTAPNHTAHIKFMTQFIANDPKYKVFKVVDTQYAQDDDSKSYDVAVNLMQAHPNLRVIISSSAVSAPAGARAIVASGKAGKVFSTGFALPNAIKSYIQDGSEKAFALWDPYELGYLAVYATHLKLAGKLEVKEGVTFQAGKAGQYTVGKDGEIVYGKPLIFTKETIDKFNF
jgi:rhamnose transport system substrate-binding protein